jgi:hypothetical protein
MCAVDEIHESEYRIAHISYLEGTDDTCLAIASDNSYTIFMLDGERGGRQKTALSSLDTKMMIGGAKQEFAPAREYCIQRHRRLLLFLAILTGVLLAAMVIFFILF